jgi:hypothetical protein
MALKHLALSLATVLALAACDQRPGGPGATVPAPSDVIDAVPTEDSGERGSTPLPVARPAARPQTAAVAEPEDDTDDDAPEAATPTTTLNTTPPKVTAPVAPPPIVIVPPAPAPTPEPAPEG